MKIKTQVQQPSTPKQSYNDNLTANLTNTKYTLVKNIIKQFGIISTNDIQNWDICWTDNMVAPQKLASMKNDFIITKEFLSTKSIKNGKEILIGIQLLPKNMDLRAYLQYQSSSTVVIAKPKASSQGKGIFLANKIEQFDYGQHYVVQQYINKPLTIQGLKFDLRIYVLVLGCDPLRVYVYKQGLARFATQEYAQPNKQNINNLFMHLTNYSINKKSGKYKFNISSMQMNVGHKRSLSSVASLLGQNWNHIWIAIKDIIVKTLISTQPILSHNYRSCQPNNIANNMCFQILGFDIIIDSTLKPYLLEVNYTPSFTTDTPLDYNIKESLIKQTLKLVNISSSSKQQVIKRKKQQLMQRTLTGKNKYHQKQSINKIKQNYAKQRDEWENAHLGNFEKLYPLQQQQQKLYSTLLKYSQSCYDETTGANIIRNIKFIHNNHSLYSGNLQIYKQTPKFTDYDKLSRIYKSSIKPIYKKKNYQTNPNNKATTNKPESISKTYKQNQTQQIQCFNKLKVIGLTNNKKPSPSIYNLTFN